MRVCEGSTVGKESGGRRSGGSVCLARPLSPAHFSFPLFQKDKNNQLKLPMFKSLKTLSTANYLTSFSINSFNTIEYSNEEKEI